MRIRCIGNLEARILPNHAAFISLALNMQLLFLNSRFGSACFWPGQASRRQTPLSIPYPACGVDPWVTDYITPLASPPSRPMQSVNQYRMFLAGQQACPQRPLLSFLGHLGRSSHPVSLWIGPYLSLRSSYLVGPKWSFLHKMAFSDPSRVPFAAAHPKTNFMSSLIASLAAEFIGLFPSGCL